MGKGDKEKVFGGLVQSGLTTWIIIVNDVSSIKYMIKQVSIISKATHYKQTDRKQQGGQGAQADGQSA